MPKRSRSPQRNALPSWETNPLPLGVTPEVANDLMELAGLVGREGLGERQPAKGFMLIAGDQDRLMSSGENSVGNYGDPKYNRFKDGGLEVTVREFLDKREVLYEGSPRCSSASAWSEHANPANATNPANPTNATNPANQSSSKVRTEVLPCFGMDKAMIFDGQTGRILANKYGVSDISQGDKRAGTKLQAASAIAQKGFFAIKVSEDDCMPGGNPDGEMLVFPGTKKYFKHPIKTQEYPEAMVKFSKRMKLSEAQLKQVLQAFEEVGVSDPDDCAKLDDEEIASACKDLPRLVIDKFTEAVRGAKLKAAKRASPRRQTVRASRKRGEPLEDAVKPTNTGRKPTRGGPGSADATDAAPANDTDRNKKPLVEYQDTTTWPSWADRPHTEIGMQVRVFQLEIQKDQVVFQFGTFCHWTLEDGSEAIDDILDGLRKKKKLYEDPHGFEHFKGLHLEEAFEGDELAELDCPKFDVINHVKELEESIENRDLTVLKAPDNSKWLFQFRKFTVACTYAPGYDYAEFAANQLTIKLELSLREEKGRRFVEMEGLPSVVFHQGLSAPVMKQYSFELMEDDTVGINHNRGPGKLLKVTNTPTTGFAHRSHYVIFLKRPRNLVLYALVGLVCFLGLGVVLRNHFLA